MKRLGVLMTHVYNDDVISSMVSCWPLLVYIKYVYMYIYIYHITPCLWTMNPWKNKQKHSKAKTDCLQTCDSQLVCFVLRLWTHYNCCCSCGCGGGGWCTGGCCCSGDSFSGGSCRCRLCRGWGACCSGRAGLCCGGWSRSGRQGGRASCGRCSGDGGCRELAARQFVWFAIPCAHCCFRLTKVRLLAWAKVPRFDFSDTDTSIQDPSAPSVYIWPVAMKTLHLLPQQKTQTRWFKTKYGKIYQTS